MTWKISIGTEYLMALLNVTMLVSFAFFLGAAQILLKKGAYVAQAQDPAATLNVSSLGVQLISDVAILGGNINLRVLGAVLGVDTNYRSACKGISICRSGLYLCGIYGLFLLRNTVIGNFFCRLRSDHSWTDRYSSAIDFSR
jgi:hypothetical protein